MRVLVTGGDGFIGQHVVTALRERGHHVYSEFFEIRDPEAVEIAFAFEPSAVIHLAAQASVQLGLEDPAETYSVNVVGTQRIADAALRCGAHVVFASSGGCVYGDGMWEPWIVGDRLKPIEPYGLSKKMAEEALDLSGVSRTVLRLGNVYGPRDTRGVISKIIKHGDEFQINGNGRQTRDYVWIGDVVDHIVRAAEVERGGTFNIGTGVETSVLELCSLLGVRVLIPPKDTPLPVGEVRRNALQAGGVWTSLEEGLDSW